jgi:hypothetical protein
MGAHRTDRDAPAANVGSYGIEGICPAQATPSSTIVPAAVLEIGM